MSDAFNASPAKVGILLSTSNVARERIVVPPFQRGYMWKKKHVEAFWQDVDKQRVKSRTRGSDPHFFGPIVTLSKAADGTIWLLDGQQRLATATILFSVLRDIAREIERATGIRAASDFAAVLQAQYICNEDGEYSLQMGETDQLYFRETIQSVTPLTTKTKQTTHRNIQTARSVLYQSVASLIGHINPQVDALVAINILKEIRQTIVSDLVMARIPVNSDEAAFRIFTTLNDRGLRLSPPDLLLSFLMETADPADRTEIRSIWTQMIQKMGTHDIEDFLRAMWVSRYGDLKEDLFVALKTYISTHQIKSRDYATLCLDECDDYLAIVSTELDQSHKGAISVVRSITRQLNIRAAVPLLLSSYSTVETHDFENIARYILIFATRYSIIGNRNTAGMENLMFQLAREVRDKMGDLRGDRKLSQQIANHVKHSLSNYTPDDPTTKQAVVDQETTLSSSDAKYVINKIAAYIQDKEKQVGPTEETNIEHIYPQNPAVNEWGGLSNQEKLEPLTWHMGNLTIYGKRANRKAANGEFPQKRLRYDLSRVEMTKEIAEAYSQWDETTILRRAGRLADCVIEIWRYENPSYV